ncbi:phosphatidylserine decarboxylase [uncultured Ilyobacter sp.]|uniref:phosphatidylserine decarboxylase n=1 Tax=uncultured Ilyobacter sp. TaxID=544433 RepID=UPI0029C77985|nr:phosphatidylserine decarboxylase [uncultured Ilyobacter sp.]
MKFEKIKYLERKTGEIKQEKVPGESYLKFLYYNPFGKLPLEFIVKRKFLSSLYGRMMDRSKSREKISSFIEENNIKMKESVKEIGEFNSFNDFFIRKLKKDARKISKNKDELSSPADGKILAYETIDKKDKFFLKGSEFSLGEFLKNDKLADKFQGGTFVIVRLAPSDYHRFHFPAGGSISDNKKIDGYYYSVSPYAIKRNFMIFCENKREYALLDSEEFGDILLGEIGATMVGGIKQTYVPNTLVEKGDEKGYFYFGGSTCIMLFESGKIKIDKDIVENTLKGIETKIYMGEKIGIATKK